MLLQNISLKCVRQGSNFNEYFVITTIDSVIHGWSESGIFFYICEMFWYFTENQYDKVLTFS